jgi:hypothetical protein
MTRLRSTLAITAVLALGSVSQAATFATPLVGVPSPSALLNCNVSNLNTKPAVVSVTFFDLGGNVIDTAFDDCNGSPLPPGATCGLQISGGSARCVIVANTDKIRAAVQLFLPGEGPTQSTTVVPATK